jgi:hypothetical protein
MNFFVGYPRFDPDLDAFDLRTSGMLQTRSDSDSLTRHLGEPHPRHEGVACVGLIDRGVSDRRSKGAEKCSLARA